MTVRQIAARVFSKSFTDFFEKWAIKFASSYFKENKSFDLG